MHPKPLWSKTRFFTALRYALQGLVYLVRTQRNVRIHLLAALNALTLGAFLPLTRGEWLALLLTIALVLATEGVNTAIEAVVDVATQEFHPLAKIAKDVAAGTVLFCALVSVIIGCLIFLPHLTALLHR
jgi:diacylglycerol kinase (ATP)